MDPEFSLTRTLLPTAALYRQRSELPNRVALVDNVEAITYTQLLDLVKETATRLSKLGVAQGDRVILISANNVKFPIIVYACYFLGAIIVPANYRLTQNELRFVVLDCQAKVIVYDFDRKAIALQASSGTSVSAISIYRLTESESPSVPSETSQIKVSTSTPIITGLESAQAIMYTSGTTGRPKGAVLTYANLNAAVSRISTDWHCRTGQDVFYIITPMFHIGAFDFIATGFANGATCVVAPTNRFNAGQVLDDMERHEVTHTYFVPVQMQMLVDEQRRKPRTLALKLYAWGAAPASNTLLTDMRKLFPRSSSQATFGQTETSGLGVTMTHEDSIRKYGSVGRADQYFSIKIVDNEMKEVAPGKVGEIVYRGPGVMDRYWGNKEATDDAFRGGWFHSGDLVKRDNEGFLYVVDRLKDMIISGGENIYSAELENVIALHEKVQYVAIVGKPDKSWGEIPVALIVPKSQENVPTLVEIRDFCSQQVARYKLPKLLVICKEFPRNATGKVLKTVLRTNLDAILEGAEASRLSSRLDRE